MSSNIDPNRAMKWTQPALNTTSEIWYNLTLDNHLSSCAFSWNPISQVHINNNSPEGKCLRRWDYGMLNSSHLPDRCFQWWWGLNRPNDLYCGIPHIAPDHVHWVDHLSGRRCNLCIHHGWSLDETRCPFYGSLNIVLENGWTVHRQSDRKCNRYIHYG